MPAQMRIDQATLGAGTPGVSRTDGLDDGSLVTLTSLGGGTTHRFELLDFPDGDTTAEASLAPTGPTVWTFTPTALVWGTYRIRLITDEGLPTESRQTRILGVRLPNSGLLIPAWNEIADPNGSRINETATVVAASENNEPSAEFAGGEPRGWYPALRALFLAVDGGGSQDIDIAIENGTTIADGEAVAGINPGSGPWRATRANASAGGAQRVAFIGIAIEGGTGDFAGTVRARVRVAGIVDVLMAIDGGFFTAPGAVYLDTVAGQITSTPPVGVGEVVLRVGQAYRNTEMFIAIGEPVTL